MSRKNHSHILLLLDRSGSMAKIKPAVIKGFNTFVQAQRKVEGTADLTLVQFNDTCEVQFDGVPLEEVPDLTEATFQTSSRTALFDAVGQSMELLGRKLAEMKEVDRPDRVVVSVLTDGFENASVDYSLVDIQKRVEHQQSFYNWEFIFLAADPRSMAIAAEMGVPEEDQVSWISNPEDVLRVMKEFSGRMEKKRRK
jgi:uncharacterized protein YegL